MITEKAKREIEKINTKITSLKEVDKELSEELKNSSTVSFQAIRKERNRVENQIYKLEHKIELILSEEISTSERSSLKREAFDSFTIICSEKSLGITQYTKIGFSKTLQAYVKAELTRYSGFMSNVRGCGSLANTRELDTFEIITKENYDEIIQKNARKVIGYTGQESIVPIY